MTYGKGGSITQTGNQGLRRGVVALVRLMWGTHPCDIIIDYWIHRKSPLFTHKICLFGEKRKEEKIRKEKSGIKRKKIEEMRKVKNSMRFMLGKLMWMLVGMKSCELIFDFRCGLNILKNI